MSLTYYMVKIPPLLLFIFVISFTGTVTALITYYFRKYIKVKIQRSHNEVTGYFFMAIAGFYALMLSFVVFVVWDELNEIQRNVSLEGSYALSLYRDIKYYPDTVESRKLKADYLEFVYNVVNEEIPNMASMKPSLKTANSFSKIFLTIESLRPENAYKIQLLSEMFHHLNELATYRSLRVSSMNTEIPAPIWIPIILGALITMLCALLVDIENINLHVGLNTLMGVFIGMLLFIIILFDHPFTGSLAIEPKSYLEIFNVNELQLKDLE